MNACILVVDDDPEIVGAIAITLEREGYRVLRAYDGMEALDLALDPAVRLILIDVMMPKLDGLSALLRIREKRNLPVIVLSAKSEDTDKILGLSMGADDYVTKPFNPQELAARVRSQLRRYTLLGDVHAEERQGLIVNGRLTYDPDRRELRADGEAVKLTATETKIVDLLMRNPGRIFPAEEIYRRVNKIAEGAAHMTETRVEIDFVKGCSNLVSNKVIAKKLWENLTELGAPEYTKEEIGLFMAGKKQEVRAHEMEQQ